MHIHDVPPNTLSGLTPREAKILRLRFGIDINTAQTLDEIGKQFDITPGSVAEIAETALRKIEVTA